ncbi:MAG: GNAT family N-acetyltransferase [Clostridiales bacterium]|nr:GNAT family N-acetyltransferase [Clostridiales bacterium]
MLFQYETERTYLKILNSQDYRLVLDFLLKNGLYYESFETKKAKNYYTAEFWQNFLTYEYELMQKGLALRFYIFLKEDPSHIIGTVSFQHITKGPFPSCQIGYKFDPSYQHLGLATESIREAIKIVALEFGICQIHAFIMNGNIPSISLIKRLGFQYNGISKKHAKIMEIWKDHLQFSLTFVYQ